MQNSGNQPNQFKLDDLSLNSDMAKSGQSELDAFNLNANEWGQVAPTRNSQALGNKIISSSEIPAPTPELGQVVSLELPPSAEPISTPQPPVTPQQNTPPAPQSVPYDRSGLRTTTKLDKRGVAAVNQVISKLGQDGNVVDFYNNARHMMVDNLEQSYQRTLEGNK